MSAGEAAACVAQQIDAWTRRMTVVLLNVEGRAPVAADLVAIKAALATKPEAGLPGPWWDLVEIAAQWVETAERAALPRIVAKFALAAALAAPVQKRHAWQDRAGAE